MMAGRAVRRIKDYLMRSPEQSAIRVVGEHGAEDPEVPPSTWTPLTMDLVP